MRFVRGGTLADRLAELRADPKAAVRLLVKVIDAVEYLHRQGQVHRDLKPTNLLLDEAGEPYLSDFGLVKDLSDVVGPDDLIPASPPCGRVHQPAGRDADGSPVRRRPAAHADRGQARHVRVHVSGTGGGGPAAGRSGERHLGPGVILYEVLTGRRPDRDAPSALLGGPGAGPRRRQVPVARPCEPYPSAALLAADLRAWLAPAPAAPVRRRWQVAARRLPLSSSVRVLRWRSYARRRIEARTAVRTGPGGSCGRGER